MTSKNGGQNAARIAAVRRSARGGQARQTRIDAGLSLRDVADACGVAASTVLRWESREVVPRGAAALRWAAILTDLEKVIRS